MFSYYYELLTCEFSCIYGKLEVAEIRTNMRQWNMKIYQNREQIFLLYFLLFFWLYSLNASELCNLIIRLGLD